MSGHTAAPVVPAAPEPRRGSSTLRLLAGQVRYADRSFWRRPLAAFFTIAFPLSFLVLICAIVGNELVDAQGGVRVAQLLTPAFVVFGVTMASFPALAIAVAEAREAGVLKRLRGAPVPMSVQLGGRIGSAIWVSAVTVVLLVTVGAVAYNVWVPWNRMPALVLTLLVGIVTFAALGLAVVSLAHSVPVVQAATTGIVIPLAFISDIFNFGQMPQWLEQVGWFFPLRHFANAVEVLFDPYRVGNGPDWDHLGVMALWGLAAAAVAVRRFSTSPSDTAVRTGSRGPRPAVAETSTATVAGVQPGGGAAWTSRRTRAGRAALRGFGASSARWCGTAARCSSPSGSRFVLLVLFHVSNPGARYGDTSLDQWMVAAFSAYGIAVTTYVNLPELMVVARENGAYKRLQGTPLSLVAYLGGAVLAACGLSAFTVLVMYGVGAAFLDMSFPASAVLPTVAVFVVGTACWTALGLALSSITRSGRTVAAVALGTLLPLCFVSDVFVVGAELPSVLSAVGWTFPLRHFAHAAFEATRPGTIAWGNWCGHLGVLALWTVAGVLVFWWVSRRDAVRSGR